MQSTTICLAMIVKNEAGVILESLSRVADHIHSWVICDTGSTDNTCETVRRFFAEKDIPGELFQDTWVDFAHNRTLAIQRALKRADYVWVLDADDLLTGTLSFPSEMTADAYSLQYGDESCLRFQRPQLFSSRLEWEYKGVLHEFPCRVDSVPYTLDFIKGKYFMDYMHSRRNVTNDRGKNPLKYLRDAQLMEKALPKETNMVYYWRYLYYIAQSYFDYGDYEKALEYFQRHLEGVRNEDTYFCHFYSASALHALDKEKNEAGIIGHFLKGMVLDPSRAECPFFLARWYFDSAQYEKARSTLAQCRNLALPNTPQKVLSSIYQFDAKWLSVQTCHILGRDAEEKEIWQQLFTGYPEVVERVDVRLYPLAVEYLESRPCEYLESRPCVHESQAKSQAQPQPPTVVMVSEKTNDSLLRSLTDPETLTFVCSERDAASYRYRLVMPATATATATWLFVRPWSLSNIVSKMTMRNVSKMYLSRGETLFEPNGTAKTTDFLCYVQDTHCPDLCEEWWNESLCTRFPLASYESLACGGHSGQSDTMTVSVGIETVSFHDLLTAFFLFALCGELGFHFRFSTKPYRGSLPFAGEWNTKQELIEVLRTQPLFGTGDFFRVDWLPLDYREVAWPRFKAFVGADKAKAIATIQHLDSSFQPQYFSEVLGVDTFVVEDENHPLWPLVAHLVVLFDTAFVAPSPLSLLDFSSVCSEVKFACFYRPVAMQTHACVTNEILLYSSVFTDSEGSSELELRVDEDYTLSEPFLTWQVSFMDLVYHVRQWKEPWSAVLLDVAEENSERVLSRVSQHSNAPFRLFHKSTFAKTVDSAPLYRYPLFHRSVSESRQEPARYVHFPNLHFVDSEVYYSATHRPPGHGFDAYNDLGFYKKWVKGRTQHFELDVGNGYPGDWVAISRTTGLSTRNEQSPDSPKTVIPRIAKSQVPLYGLQWKKRSSSLPVLPVQPLDTLHHPDLWEALSHDFHHDYYVVVEKEVTFCTARPYFEDVQASVTMLLKLLQEKPSWDILVLGTAFANPVDGKSQTPLILESYTYTPESKQKVLGYMIHKKTACFLSTLVRHVGTTESLEELWTHFSVIQPFLAIYQLSYPLVQN